MAKLLGAICFGNAPFLQTLFSEAIDQGSVSIRSFSERRSAERFISECADRIIEQSTAFIDIEFRALSDERKQAIFDDVNAAITQSTTTTNVIKNLFDRSILVRSIMDAVPAYDTFSQAEKDLMQTLIENISTYICTYISTAPDFVPLSIKHLLKQANDIRTLLTAVLESQPQNDAKHVKYGRDRVLYNERIKNHFGLVEIFGLSLHSLRRRYHLETAYISLSVSTGP